MSILEFVADVSEHLDKPERPYIPHNRLYQAWSLQTFFLR